MNKVYTTLLFLFTIILLKFHTTDAMIPCRSNIECIYYCQARFHNGIGSPQIRGRCLNNRCSCYSPA
jgi:hypothetical protein